MEQLGVQAKASSSTSVQSGYRCARSATFATPVSASNHRMTVAMASLEEEITKFHGTENGLDRFENDGYRCYKHPLHSSLRNWCYISSPRPLCATSMCRRSEEHMQPSTLVPDAPASCSTHKLPLQFGVFQVMRRCLLRRSPASSTACRDCISGHSKPCSCICKRLGIVETCHNGEPVINVINTI
jgi:hypothetical protein